MKIIIAATDEQKLELVKDAKPEAELVWVNSSEKIFEEADAYVDLLFQPSPGHIEKLHSLLPRPVIINSIAETLADSDPGFVRINGWRSFLSGHTIEGSAGEPNRKGAEAVFQALGKKVEWLPDLPGFITPRVVSMIINEAFFALDEGVSTREEIDTAMKLGTAYPYGPFEWAEIIGLKNIVALLHRLAADEPRYRAAPLLGAEAAKP